MPLALPLPPPHGHYYYDTAQLAAFAVYVGLLLGQGYRRGYAARVWLPLVAASTLALVLGCQLVCLPPDYWAGWLRGDADAIATLADGPRSIVGGAWGVFLVVLALRRPLGFRGGGVFDAFAGPLCWALAVQSVGCVLAGCCWGEATAGNWGLTYGPGTPAYAAQGAQALVPTQLLQLLACAGAGLALHLTRHRRWAAGSRYLLGLGLLCLGRLVVETWRDPASEPLLTNTLTLAGVSLRGLQWLILLEVLILLGGWAWLLRRAATPKPAPATAPRPAAPALVGLGLLLVTSRLGSATLAGAEVVTLQLLLLLVLLAEGRTWLVTLGRGVPRLAGLPLAALLGGLVLLGTAQAPAPQDNPQPDRTVTLTGGYIGNNHDAIESFSNGGGCGSGSTLYNLHQQVQAGGLEIARQRERHNGKPGYYTVGGGLWAGQQYIDSRTLPLPNFTPSPSPGNFPLLDLHGYFEGRVGRGWTTMGLRIGGHLGDLGQYSYYSTDASRDAVAFMPEGMLSYGNPQFLYAQADAGYGAENALGSYATRLALGSGLGLRNGTNLLVGYANAAHNPTPNLAFASANVHLPASTGLSIEPYFATDFDQHHMFSLKLHYRLGLR